MAARDLPVAEAFGHCRGDVVVTKGVEHGGPHEPREGRHHGDRESDDRKDIVLRCLKPGRGQHPQIVAEIEDHPDPDDKMRHGISQERKSHPGPRPDGTAVERGGGAEGNANGDRQSQGETPHGERSGHPVGKHLPHDLGGVERPAEIPLGDLADVGDELFKEWPVQPVLGFQCGLMLCRDPLGIHALPRGAGKPQGQERDHQDDEHRHHSARQTNGHESQHRRSLPLSGRAPEKPGQSILEVFAKRHFTGAEREHIGPLCDRDVEGQLPCACRRARGVRIGGIQPDSSSAKSSNLR